MYLNRSGSRLCILSWNKLLLGELGKLPKVRRATKFPLHIFFAVFFSMDVWGSQLLLESQLLLLFLSDYQAYHSYCFPWEQLLCCVLTVTAAPPNYLHTVVLAG